MLKIVLATATFLLASGMAFAGSDHFGSDYSHGHPKTGHHSMASDNGYPVDPSGTASVDTGDSAPTSAGNSTFDFPEPGYGQGIWGSR